MKKLITSIYILLVMTHCSSSTQKTDAGSEDVQITKEGDPGGDFIVDNFAWVNHNIWDNLLEVGVTSRGNRIKVNYNFIKADLRVTVSGIKGHGTAGYGGGGKAVLPAAQS